MVRARTPLPPPRTRCTASPITTQGCANDCEAVFFPLLAYEDRAPASLMWIGDDCYQGLVEVDTGRLRGRGGGGSVSSSGHATWVSS